MHRAQFDSAACWSFAARLAVDVNSSHHQSVHEPGRGLRITAHAPDGVVEAVEWTGDLNWLWACNGIREDAGGPLTQALFRDLLTAARHAGAAK